MKKELSSKESSFYL